SPKQSAQLYALALVKEKANQKPKDPSYALSRWLPAKRTLADALSSVWALVGLGVLGLGVLAAVGLLVVRRWRKTPAPAGGRDRISGQSASKGGGGGSPDSAAFLRASWNRFSRISSRWRASSMARASLFSASLRCALTCPIASSSDWCSRLLRRSSRRIAPVP